MSMIFRKVKRFTEKEDNLVIFLFYKLIYQREEILNFKKDYEEFKITDSLHKKYDEWVEKNEFDIVKLWIKNNQLIVNQFYNEFTINYQPKVIIWNDRKKNEYYLNMLQKSHEFECYLENLFREKYNLELGIYDDQNGQYNKGECELGIEIKFDMMSAQTGNLYIEYAEKSNSKKEKYISSGILKNDETLYFLIGDKDNFYVFPKKNLYDLYKEQKNAINNNVKNIPRKVRFIQKETSLGFIIGIKYINDYIISIDDLINNLKAKNE